MAVFFHTADDTDTTDASQIDTLASGDDLIVTREATLLTTGVGSVVVRASDTNNMTLNGELFSAENVILATAGSHNIAIGSDGVLSSLGSFDAIDLAAGLNTISNAGEINGSGSAIEISGDGNEITNTGLMTGALEVIDVSGGDTTVVNHGTITGLDSGADGVILRGGAVGSNLVHNTGEITGFEDDGVELQGDAGTTNTLINSGTITSVGEFNFAFRGGNANDAMINTGVMDGGVNLDGGNDLLDTRNGTLEGQVLGGDGNDTMRGSAQDDSFLGENNNDVLEGFAGDDTLDGGNGVDILNGGLGLDDLIGGAGQDFASYARAAAAVQTNLGNATLNTGEAAGDTFDGIENLIGSRFNDRLTGDGLDNTLNGSSGADTLVGGAGNDVLLGGLDADVMAGNAGLDAFVFRMALGAGNVDQITDYVVADDTIQLEDAVFTGLVAGALPAGAFRIGAAAADANDRVIYNDVTGDLLFDSNGSAAGGAVQFAELDPGLAVTAADFDVI